MEQRKRDLLAGGCILALGLIIVFALIPLGVVEPTKVKFAALSPSYYPRLVGIMLILLGLLIMGVCLFKSRNLPSTESQPALSNTRPDAWIRLLIVLIVLAAFAALLEPVGFVLTSAAVLLSMLLLGGERRIGVLLGISLIAPVLLYYFFVKVPRIPIPNGVLTGVLPGA